jgi:hypothetical protein
LHPSSSSPPRPVHFPSHPDSPYSAYPPPYQPYEYASGSPTIHYPPTHMGNYQFSKGGRTIHSEPVILKKKFSWRNYPEVRVVFVALSNLFIVAIALTYLCCFETCYFISSLRNSLLPIARNTSVIRL